MKIKFKSKQKVLDFMKAHVRKNNMLLLQLYNFSVFCEQGDYYVVMDQSDCDSNKYINGLSFYFKNEVYN